MNKSIGFDVLLLVPSTVLSEISSVILNGKMAPPFMSGLMNKLCSVIVLLFVRWAHPELEQLHTEAYCPCHEPEQCLHCCQNLLSMLLQGSSLSLKISSLQFHI